LCRHCLGNLGELQDDLLILIPALCLEELVALFDQLLLGAVDPAVSCSDDERVQRDEVFMVKSVASHLNKVKTLSLEFFQQCLILVLVLFVVYGI